MADYNVNMKQWNGTSFDNVLPLAYNAKQLGGQSLEEVKQWVQDNGLMLYTGQYTGTGTYGQSHPTVFTFPFEPVLFILPVVLDFSGYPNRETPMITNGLTTNYQFYYGATSPEWGVKISANKKTLSLYSPGNPAHQFNDTGRTYYFAAIGGYDMGGTTEWTITQSGTWTVPRTGRYYIELYGGGGGAYETVRAVQGGSSCQSYASVSLTKGDVIPVSVGIGGACSYNDASISKSTGTTFGNYSVDGGGQGLNTGGGDGAGNLGTKGTFDFEINKSNGFYGSTYGYGGFVYPAGYTVKQGGPGAVYLKYLGE